MKEINNDSESDLLALLQVLHDKQQVLNTISVEIQELHSKISSQADEITALKHLINEQIETLAARAQMVASLTAQLTEIINSKAWFTLLFFRRIRERLFPHGGRRDKFLRNVMSFIYSAARQSAKDPTGDK